MKKRIISLILVLVMSVTFATGAFATGDGFKDVSEDNWFYSYVTELADLGIIGGYSDGTYRPNGFITYGQALKLILMAAGYEEQAATDSHWASGYLDLAYKAGFVDTNEIELDSYISRLDVAKIAVGALGIYTDAESPFADTDDSTAVALYNTGVISGIETEDGLIFDCHANIKRSEMSKVISKMMSIDFAEFIPKEEVVIDKAPEEPVMTHVLITCDGFLNIRTEPSTEAEVAGRVLSGRTPQLLETLDGWYKVSYKDVIGYVSADYCTPVDYEVVIDNSGLRDDIVEFALQFIGVKYVYGGQSPKGFDCSGFTMYVMGNYGYSLSHSARAQYSSGVEISKDELQPGDLVFFSNASTSWIGHCGLYIGNGQFIHASSGKAYSVTISDLGSDWYTSHYISACRIIEE